MENVRTSLNGNRLDAELKAALADEATTKRLKDAGFETFWGPGRHGPGNNVNLQDKVSLWSQTAHASFFQKSIDGEESSHYGKNCISCHTIGNNPAPTAVNGGFDDVAKELGWTFPSILQPGNWDAMPSALKAKANIQCESCHGAGSRHPGSPSVSIPNDPSSCMSARR